jgi:multidrug efflux pump
MESTVRRARPVILIALAAIFAKIPLSSSAFWGPMAITTMDGLPAFYAVGYRGTLKREVTGHTVPPELAVLAEHLHGLAAE